MFNKDYSKKYAIRKLKVTTASLFIGLSFLGASETAAQSLKAGVDKEVSYKYVLDSELTEAEKNLIVKELPSGQVSEYETYYMVYKEENGTVLPKTKAIVRDNFDYITAALGAGLVLLALKYSKKRRKIIVSSIFLLTAVGTYSVSAIENVKLAGYDKVFTLKTGEALPETKLEIDKHKFVGYILVDNKEDVMEPCPEDTKKEALDQTKVEDKAQISAKDVKDTQVERVNPIASKGSALVQEAKPEVHIPVTTSAATQAPVTQVVTVAPVTQTKAEAAITEVVTEAPVTKVITEAPVTRVVTEAPVTKIITEAPVTKVITEAPVTRVVTEAPVSRVIAKPGQNLTHEKPEVQVVTEAPVTRIVTEAPVTRIITEAPVTRIVTEAPISRVVTEPGTTRVVTEEATTRIIGKAPALVQEEKPSIPIVTSKSIPVVEEAKPEAPTPEITRKGTPLEQETKPEILIETSKVTPLEQEEKPEIPVPSTATQTTVATTKAPETTTPTTVATTKAPETTVPTTVSTTKAPETTVSTTVSTTKAPETTTTTTVTTTAPVVNKLYKITYVELDANNVPKLHFEYSDELPEITDKSPLSKDSLILPSLYEFVEIPDPEQAPMFRDGENHYFVYVKKKEILDFDKTISEIKDLTSEVRQQLADSTRNTNIPKVTQELTQDQLTTLKTQLIDEKKFNEEMLKLVNEERTKAGLQPITIHEELKAGADLRTSEQAATGYFRSGDTNGDGIGDGKHIRPDGSEWGTAFTYLKQVSPRGENMGQFATDDLRELVSEAYLAKKQFELFKSSSEHYANIMDPRHNVGYFSFGFSADHKILVANKERPEHTSAEQVNGQGVIFTQVFGRERAVPLP